MDFQDVVHARRMVRRYSAKPVHPDAIERMLHNAVRAPNAGFTQGWAFLVLDQPNDVARFWSSTASTMPNPARSSPSRSSPSLSPVADSPGHKPSRWLDGMRTAPVVIVPLSSKAAYVRRYAENDKGWSAQEEPRWAVPYWHVDAGMAALLILQTAVDEGLGGCFFGLPPAGVDPFRAEFGVPAEYAPVGAITIGHPASGDRSGSPTRRARKPQADVVHRGRWQP